MDKRTMTTTIRLPVELHERVKRIGDNEVRSVNNLLIVWLREAVERYEREHPELREEEGQP